MEDNERGKDKRERVEMRGRELQKRIRKTYGVDMDPLYAVDDAKEVGRWLLELNRYKVETIDPDDEEAQKAEDIVHSFYEAFREMKVVGRDDDPEASSPEKLQYLKQALLDRGIEYIKEEAIADANTDKMAVALAGEKLPDLGFERGFGAAGKLRTRQTLLWWWSK